jgi:transposase
VLDVRELIRRIGLGDGIRRVARDMGVSRKTVAKYLKWASEQGLLSGSPVEAGELKRLLDQTMPVASPPRGLFKVERYREQIRALRDKGVEARAIYDRLKQDKEFTASYSAVWRFVRALEPATPEGFVRVETPPGDEAQVDFGYAGLMYDPATGSRRRAWAFVMTLSFSRHQYVELVFDQEVGTWLKCHRSAFEWFGGVVRRVVLDNLKAAIVRHALHDSVVQRAYREFAEHYGFLISPCKPRTPRHKGKVEKGGVHYVKRNLLAGQEFADVHEANRKALVWCVDTAGKREHGTTKQQPLKRFDEAERAALLPLPASPYELAVWKKAKLHPDCHVVFDGSFYSAPHRLIGKSLWVKAASGVTIYHEHDVVAVHPRATRPGQRLTNNDHYPPGKVAGLMASPAWCLKRATAIGPATCEMVGRLLADRPLDRLRTAQAILRLADKYSARRLEAACSRALLYDEHSYGSIKRILDRKLDLNSPPAASPTLTTTQPLLFVRPWTDFFGNA